MSSFWFGLGFGFTAGLVTTALMKRAHQEPSMEEKLLEPVQTPSPQPDTPTSLADVLPAEPPSPGDQTPSQT